MQRLCTIFFLLLLPTLGEAQTDTISTSIFDLDIEELLNYNVESATKSSVSVQKAPSVVRMFTKDDFIKYGFTTIQDVLNTIPGMQIQEYRAGHQLVWIRGVQARYNNKVLMLIDGVPMRDSYYGNFLIDEMIPLEVIEKIEILNGPGSVLYGANSFSGVISITTKKEGKSIGADVGTFNTYSIQGEFDTKGLYVNANYFSTDGFQPDFMADGVHREVDQSSQGQFGLIKYNKNNFSIMGGVANYGQPYKYRSSKREYYFDRAPIFGNVKYKKEIGKSSALNINSYVNYFSFTRNKTKYISKVSDELKETSVNPLNTMLIGADLDYNLKLNKHEIIGGLSWQQDRAIDIHEEITFSLDPEDLGREEAIINPNFSRDVVGLFVQDVYTITENINATAGLRYDILSNFDNQFNYRLGLTGQWESGIYAKLLYGTAYRVPSYREYITKDAPNAELTPEHLKTFEAQLGYLINKKADINVTFYNNDYSNFIQEIIVDSISDGNGGFNEVDDEMAINWKSRNITGLELNSNIRPSKSISMNIGMAFILSAKETAGDLSKDIYTSQTILPGEQNITFLSSFNAFAATNYTFLEKYSISLNGIYFNDRNTPVDYQSESDVTNPNNAEGYFKLDLAISGKFMQQKLRATARVSNLLGSKIYSTPYGGSSGYDAQWPGRTLRLAVNYTF